MTTGGVVEAGLGFQDAGEPTRQGHVAQDREDRRRVGGGHHCADDQGLPPVDTGQIVRGGRGDADAHRDTEGGEHGRGGQGRFDLVPLGAEAALGEDHDECRVTDDLGQAHVVEDDADAVLADGDADAQIDEQAGQPAAR
ncbi:hypothetical protein GCM10020000_47310 [Streptomyces olivoverticillatus]